MSITYCLFDRKTKRCINLGKKINSSSFGFEGPIFYSQGAFHLLPEDLRHLLQKRFTEIHGEENVALIADWELFDSGDYLQSEEETIQVGGDEDNSIPLEFYLPELVQTASNKAA